MTAESTQTGAPSTRIKTKWQSIDWHKVEKHVRRLQMRIAKAVREGKHCKAKSLQWILTHSFYAKLLAVKRVTENRGSRTAELDNVNWNSANNKMKAALSLSSGSLSFAFLIYT